MTENNPEPMMFDFYTRFYTAVASSAANAAYCERVYGRNLCQHGFADLADLDHLIRVSGISVGSRVLDLGCGNGMIAEYISDQTSAHVTGVDFIEKAIQDARQRTIPKRERFDFRVMDFQHLQFPPASFDVIISIDTLYFTDIFETLSRCLPFLKENGRLAVFFDQSCGPGTPLEEYPREITQVDQTELAEALQKPNFSYQSWDYSEAMLAHLRRRRPVLEALISQFEAEGNTFLYESHLGESLGIERAYTHDAGKHYLYLASKKANITWLLKPVHLTSPKLSPNRGSFLSSRLSWDQENFAYKEFFMKKFFKIICILAGLIILAVLIIALLTPWMDRWGATDEEIAAAFPGDALVPDPASFVNRAITIQAAPEYIYPWIVQLDALKGGWYSYSWLESLVGCSMINADRIHPEWQNLQVGDEVHMCPDEPAPPPYIVAQIHPNQAIVMGHQVEGEWVDLYQFVIVPQTNGTTRLILRTRTQMVGGFWTIFHRITFIMERGMLRGLKERAENLAISGYEPPEVENAPTPEAFNPLETAPLLSDFAFIH